ncbi:MAG: competence protein ComE [Kaiparowitsia implicata GSE-PSE-MK54-09C]|jgi:phosphatidylserine/phosphatidylglycerophosphate/cardiolipin synthase-like enzyme|nr:competence protein ComE [Kaiparowitsia implicata GSE-PSE-MK54-09C]
MSRGQVGRSRFLILVGIGLVLVLALSLGRRNVAQSAAPLELLESLPQDAAMQVFFNQSQATLYTEPDRGYERLGDNLEQVVVDAILSAQRSVDVAVQELRLPRIAQALRDRQRAGVRVRVILENNYNQPASQVSPTAIARLTDRERSRFNENLRQIDQNQDGVLSPAEITENDALVVLADARIPLIDDRADGSKGSGLMHHKFVIVDQQRVVTGSANFTTSDMHGDFSRPSTRGNANHIVQIQSPMMAALFREEFDLMWGDGPGGRSDSLFGLQKPYRAPRQVRFADNSRLVLQFSPTSRSRAWAESGNGLIAQALAQARLQIDLALFVFSEQPLSPVLNTRHQQGISIRALIDRGFVFRSYSEALDMLGLALPNLQCGFDEGNAPWERAIATVGFPVLPEGDLLHHKFAVIDQYRVITGSQNWSAAANYNNDETVLVIDNTTVAAHFQREFERLYQLADLGIPAWFPAKVQQELQRCSL